MTSHDPWYSPDTETLLRDRAQGYGCYPGGKSGDFTWGATYKQQRAWATYADAARNPTYYRPEA